MGNQNLMEIKSFSGTLEASGYSTPVIFSASISHSGKIIFDFGIIPLTQETAYIHQLFHKESTKFEDFTLSGTSDDGTEFKTKDLYFTCPNESWSKEAGSLMRPDGKYKITALSQSEHAPSGMRVIHFLDQQPFFEAAVKSFFEPPIRVKNLFFAIEWFSMNPSYSEVRLVNAMTALENLVDSNLADHDALIQSPK